MGCSPCGITQAGAGYDQDEQHTGAHDMAVNSRVNANFPLPGVDQSSKGFRDNFSIIKSEIEALQGKRIQLTGDVSSDPTILDSGTGIAVLVTQGKVYRTSFTSADVALGILQITHDLGEQYVIVQVSNNLNQVIMPDAITLTNVTSCTINLTSFGVISGVWHAVIRG